MAASGWQRRKIRLISKSGDGAGDPARESGETKRSAAEIEKEEYRDETDRLLVWRFRNSHDCCRARREFPNQQLHGQSLMRMWVLI
jgi:hypothetical protein